MFPSELNNAIQLRAFKEPNGTLIPLEAARDIPFDVGRVFYIFGTKPQDVRGQHAHRLCKQFLICLHGACQITMDNGSTKKTIELNTPELGLYISPMTWAEEKYLSNGTILLVLTDRHYEPEDYISDYEEFRTLAARR
jgi:dTDP-4-dehydrorhamnose 3,5-epimerase-like enzyme